MRPLIRFTTLPSVLICALAGCASMADDELSGDSRDETMLGGQIADTYFEIAKDLRKCASPYCGGWFLGRLNQSMTRCHDGRYAAECYTPVLDWSVAGLSEEQQTEMLDKCDEYAGAPGVYAIVRGHFVRTSSTTQRSDLGRFVITEAWLSENDAVSGGAFVRVKDNGIRCFAAPCPSLTEETLNTTRTTDIAGLDFTPAGMTELQVEECIQWTFAPDGLLVAGDRYTIEANGVFAQGRTVTSGFYRLGNVK